MSDINHNAITGGSVTIEDGLKAKEEYAPARKVSVTLNYSTPENGDGIALLDYVIAVATGRQMALLYSKAPVPATAAAQPAALVEPAKPKAGRKAAEKPAEKTKADLEAEHLAELKAAEGKGPKDVVDELDEKPPAEKDEMADLLGDTAPTPVTDQELGKAAQEKNGKMKSVAGWAPEKIRALVGEFVQVDGKPKAGAKLQEIPAAKRHDFLAQLDALK